jgi:hypothetical protein
MADEDDKPISIRERIEEAWDEAEREPSKEVDTNRRDRSERRPPADDLDGQDDLSEGIERRPAQDGERPRDEKGRFLPQEGEERQPEGTEPKPPEQPRQEPEEQQPEKKEPAEPREVRLQKLTANWRQDHKEFLAQQSPEVQDFLVERSGEMDRAYFNKTQRLSGFLNEYGPIHQMLEPDLPAIQAAGYTPRLLIEGWANCERAMLQGPESAARMLRGIAEGYKVPREVIAHFFGFDPRTPDQIHAMGGQPAGVTQPAVTNGRQAGQFEYHDPRVDMLLADRQEQQERATIAYNQQLRTAANNAMAQIAQFKEARDNTGNLLHPYFNEVEDYMTMLAKHYGETTGKIPSLKQLYDSAVNVNPATRAKAIAVSTAAQSERQRASQAARGKAALAQRAASSVVGSGRPASRTPTAPGKGQSIRASIDAALQQHEADLE